MARFSIIGTGRVGKTFGLLFSSLDGIEIGELIARSLDSAEAAAALIGSGRAAGCIEELQPSEFFLISTPDSEIEISCQSLSPFLRPGDCVFHCSASLSSSVLNSAREVGAICCSLHPLKSFASAEESRKSFAGTPLAYEGDTQALDILLPLMIKLGAKPFVVGSDSKPLYHAASVLNSNLLLVLLECSRRTYLKAGVPESELSSVMAPLARESVGNFLKMGFDEAITGPLMRGDRSVVESHLRALSGREGELYRTLSEALLSYLELPEESSVALFDLLTARGS